MNTMKLNTMKLAIPLLVALAVALPVTNADAQVVNFDSVAGGASGAPVTNYLAGYGISFSAASNVTPHIIVAPPWSPAPSSPNIFGTTGPGTGYTYTMGFSTLMDSISFTRPQLIALTSSGVTHAQWSATAYSATDTFLGSVGENLLASFGTIAASTFTLDFGPEIDHVVFFTNVQNFAGTNLIIDNLTLTAAIPEPETYAMMLAGLGLMGWVGRRKKLKASAAA